MKAIARINVLVTGVVVVACVLLACSSAHADHWSPPTQTGYWEAVYGYLTGFTTLDDGDEVAAFNVSDGSLVGHALITQSGADYI